MQTVTDWELAVIGDGAPERTYQIVDAFAAHDSRIRSYRHPKDPLRFGEPYRDPVIRASDAEFVCHLADDDLWAPTHLAEMLALLEVADWVNQAPLRIERNGKAEWWPINHGTPAARAATARGLGLSAGINYVAYRRSAYLRLPVGWTSAPWERGSSDQYMWAKFHAEPDITVASTAQSTALKLPSRQHRRDFAPETRLAELAPWLARIGNPELMLKIRRKADIRIRTGRLFALHNGEDSDSLDGAFAAAGFLPAPAKADPVPAVGGEPMIIPLSEEQMETAWQSWAMLRVFAGGVTRLTEELASRITANGSVFRAAVKTLAIDRPEAALVAVETLGDRLTDPEVPLKLATQIRKKLGGDRPATTPRSNDEK